MLCWTAERVVNTAFTFYLTKPGSYYMLMITLWDAFWNAYCVLSAVSLSLGLSPSSSKYPGRITGGDCEEENRLEGRDRGKSSRKSRVSQTSELPGTTYFQGFGFCLEALCSCSFVQTYHHPNFRVEEALCKKWKQQDSYPGAGEMAQWINLCLSAEERDRGIPGMCWSDRRHGGELQV